jgi:hypothetical protein
MRILTLNAFDLDIGWALFKVVATMVHPENARARAEFLAIRWAGILARTKDAFKEAGVKDAGEIATLVSFRLPIGDPAAAIQLLCQASSEDKVSYQTARAFYGGYVAGRILQLMIQMQMTGYAPSVEKAVFVLEHMLAEARTLSGKKVPRSRKELYKAWRAFKSVAHFWAVFYIKYPQDQVEPLGTTGLQEHQLTGLCTTGVFQSAEPYHERFPKHLVSLLSTKPPVLLVFLSEAEWFLHWGSNHSPQHQRNPSPWLDPSTTWRCTVAGINPDRLPWVAMTLPPLTDDARAVLLRYKANNRF